MWVANKIVVTRPWEPGTVAIVSFRSRKERLAATEARRRTQLAVTRWIAETEDGSAAWRASHEDFNIGDLIDHLNNSMLITLLDDYGIRDLQIHTMSEVSMGWDYDDVLGEVTVP